MTASEGLSPRGGLASAWNIVALAAMGVIGAAVIAALIWIQTDANHQRDRALALQTHSYEVMILARSLSGTMARSEASLGRYVISGDKQLGQLYYDQWQLAGSQLDRLDTTIGARTAQQRRIDALRDAYQQRGRELELIALSTAYRKNNQALGRYYQARRSPSLERIEQLLGALFAGERQTLEVRRAAALASVAHSSAIAGGLAVFGVALVIAGILLGTATIRAQAESAVARADADAERERATELEAAVTTATDELRAQEAKLRQVQKMEAVGQLTGGIAHDFNNMLAVVLGGLELARRHMTDAPAPVRRHLDSAMEGAERAAALTRRLLAFSREDALHPEPLDAARVLAGMRDLLDRTLGDGVTVSMADGNRGWLVLADRVALENALLNLAVNARDAMDGRGVLTVSTGAVRLAANEVGHCRAGEHVTLSVSDTGCGMTPEVIERVYEPFFTTKPVGKGTGLGLSQIFALVRQLGGEIGIRSAPGAGTSVTLYLPRHEAAAGAASPLAEPAPAPEPPATPAELVVLVVEDDPRVLAATSGALEELGHRAIRCNDPLAAPAVLAASGGVDLVISDVLMPGQTGPEMIAGITARHPDLAVLFVTGYAGQAGADEFAGRHVLRKPYTLAGLERAISEAMADRAQVQEQIAAE